MQDDRPVLPRAGVRRDQAGREGAARILIALGDAPFAGRLRPNPRAKGNDRLRHQFALTSAADIDADVLGCLKIAHERDAG